MKDTNLCTRQEQDNVNYEILNRNWPLSRSMLRIVSCLIMQPHYLEGSRNRYSAQHQPIHVGFCDSEQLVRQSTNGKVSK